MLYEPGQQVGDYQILEILGAGGMGRVYKVRNVISDRVEAMKILLPNLRDNQQLAERFLREIKVQASLTHPNIATLHTALREDNQLLMIMEFVEGRSLDDMIKFGPLAPADAINYISQTLDALQCAHEHGVVHRDIKPANMMVTNRGEVKLMDFGIARLQADRKLTQTGSTVGSLYYMSPEQINGVQDLDARSDLYSLGISLYQMVTGHRPFEGDSDFKIMAGHLQQAPIPPIQLDPNVPEALNQAILMAIAKDPAHRFQSAKAMKGALASMGAMPSHAAPVATASQPVRTLPTQPTQPVYAAPPGAPPMSPPRPASSRRGLYMAVGSLATVGVLALVVTQAPKFFKAGATGDPRQQPQVAIPQAPPQTTGAPQGNEGPQTPATQTPQAAGTPVKRVHETNPAAQRPADPPPTVAAQPQARPADPPPPIAQPQQQQQETAPPARPRPDARELANLKDQLNSLAARSSAALSTVRSLEAAQARSGLGLRGDVKAMVSNFKLQMDNAEQALANGDIPAGRQHLNLAERVLERIEKFTDGR